jgi:S1-C subfamily serine protease
MACGMAAVLMAAGSLVACDDDAAPRPPDTAPDEPAALPAPPVPPAPPADPRPGAPARSAQAVPFEGVADLVEEIQPSVVAIAVASAGRSGIGSGVIVRADGVIVTNAHVVLDAAEVEVMTADGERMIATVEARDTVTDLAILRVPRTDLPAATLAEGYPRVGDLAVALGNPLGFDNTVTTGVISGLQRALPDPFAGGSAALVDLIQTDAAISPGNSGGALVNVAGEVVGITVAYIPPGLGAVSLGFAIPSPTVRDVVEALLADGTVDHPYLGVQAVPLTPQIVERFDVPVTAGVVLMTVEPGTPAARAGLQAGDVITEFGGEPVRDVGDFLTQLRRFAPGDAVEIVVHRDGLATPITAELSNRPTG